MGRHIRKCHTIESLELRLLLAAVSWDGSSGDNLWTNPANWSSDPALPGPADDVTISVPGTPTIFLSSGAQSINSLICHVALTIDGGTLAPAAASQCNGPLTLSAGAISGAGTLAVAAAFVWSGGGMFGTGTTLLPVGSSLSINTPGAHRLDRTLQVESTTTWVGGDLQFNGGTFINNGTFNTSTESNLNCPGVGGTNVFVNNGTLNKTGGGLAQFYFSSTPLPFNNNGAVNISAGTLYLETGTSTTAMTIAPTGTLTIGKDNQAYVFSGAGDINGTGTLAIGGGNLVLNTSFTVESANVLLSGGSLSGLGNVTFIGALTWTGGTVTGFGTFRFLGPLNWFAGNMTGAGTTIINPAVTATLSSLAGKSLNRTLQNAGLLVIEDAASVSGSGAIQNLGTLKKTAAGTSTISGVTLNNMEGVIQLDAGTLVVSGTFQSPAGKISTVTGPGTLTLSGNQEWGDGGQLDVNGGATVNLNRDVGAINRPELRIIFGTVNINTTQHLGPYEAISVQNEAIAITGPNSVVVAPGNSIRVVTDSINLDVAGGAKLDLNDGILIVDYPAGGPSPFTTIRGYVLAGVNNTAGIISTSAFNDASGKHGLGVAEASVLGLSSFAGEPIDSTAVIVRYTYKGDANLDGVVNITDLGILATNWQGAGGWTSGDFNHDGLVDITDLGILATNWQSALPAPAQAPSIRPASSKRLAPSVLDQEETRRHEVTK